MGINEIQCINKKTLFVLPVLCLRASVDCACFVFDLGVHRYLIVSLSLILVLVWHYAVI